MHRGTHIDAGDKHTLHEFVMSRPTTSKIYTGFYLLLLVPLRLLHLDAYWEEIGRYDVGRHQLSCFFLPYEEKCNNKVGIS